MGSAMSAAGRTRAAVHRAVTVVLLAATLVTAIGAGLGCAKDTRAFPELMDVLPISVGDFTYWDTRALNGDTNLWDIFGAFGQSADARQIEDLLMVLSKIERCARAVSYDNATLSGPTAVFRGDIDMAYLRRQMGERGYSRSANKDVEVWLPAENSTYTKAVGIRDGTLYLGDGSDIIACINVAAKGDVLSLWEDPNLKVVAGKLPDGFIVNIHQANPAHGESYTGLVAYGKSYSKANRDTLNVKAVYLFGHAPAARAAQPGIEDYSRLIFDDVSVKSEGNLVVVTARLPITRLASSLEF
jgi:hypothetical protein